MLNLAGLAGFFAVALGAFGAHALKDRVPASMLEIWKTGVLYHLIHAVLWAMVAMAGQGVRFRRAIGGLLGAGILIFSGSLYALTLTGRGMWGAVTPVGGLCFLAAWLLLALSGVVTTRSKRDTP